MSFNLVELSTITKEFQKADEGMYFFKAVATSDRQDSQNEVFDIGSLNLSCPVPPLYVSHNKNKVPVGNVLKFTKHQVSGRDFATFEGVINTQLHRDVVQKVKNSFYKGVSMGGEYESKQNNVLYGGLVGEISLCAKPVNQDALIFEKSQKLSILNFFDMTELELVEQLKSFSTENASLMLVNFIKNGLRDLASSDFGVLLRLKERQKRLEAEKKAEDRRKASMENYKSLYY